MTSPAPDVEGRLPDLLHDLADGVHAPATLDVTQAVHRRSATLRHRRRRARVGVGGGLLAVAVVAGGVWVAGTGRDARSDVSTDPADGERDGDGGGAISPIPGVPVGEPGEVPALTIEHPDVRVVAAHDEALPGAGDGGPRTDTGGVTWQVFRRPGDYAGPLVLVGSGPADDVRLGIEGLDVPEVPVGGEADAEATTLEVGAVETRFTTFDDGTALRVDAIGLDGDEIDGFHGGLRPRASGGGQEATMLPAGLEELVFDLSDRATTPLVERTLDLDHGTRPDPIHLRIESPTGADPAAMEAVFLYALWDRRTATLDDEVRAVEVLGRPAALIGATGPEPELLWLHTTSAAVDLHLPTADTSALDGLIAGIHELTPDEWSALQRAIPTQP